MAAGPCRSLLALVERDDGWAMGRRSDPFSHYACRPFIGLSVSAARAARADLDHRSLVRMVLEAFAWARFPVRPGCLREPSAERPPHQPGARERRARSKGCR